MRFVVVRIPAEVEKLNFCYADHQTDNADRVDGRVD